MSEATPVSTANNDFTKDVYWNLATTSANNAIISPFSLHVVLGLASFGAASSTADAMMKVLRIKHSETTLSNYKDIIDKLSKSPELKIANKIFVAENVKLNPTYQSKAVDNFNSELSKVDFAQGSLAAEQMNSWVSNQTNDKIKDVINPSGLPANTRLVLINAIYFKGLWTFPFKRENTEDGPFYLDNTRSVQVPLMHLKKKFHLYSQHGDDGFKVLKLPYGKEEDQNFSMHIFLPNKRDGLAELEKNLFQTNESFAEKFEKIVQGAIYRDVQVTLPRFRIESTWEMKTLLKNLGMEVAFSADADFSLMTEDKTPLAIEKVTQKAFIEVNEEGTEAAAATAVFVDLCCPRWIPFNADHPFVITICHNDKDIVFIAKVAKF